MGRRPSRTIPIKSSAASDVYKRQCEEFALSNLVKQVCDYWDSKETNVNDCAKAFLLNRCTIIEYLNKGAKYNWCDYNGHKERIKAVSKNGKSNGKKIEVYKDELLIGKYNSISETCRTFKEKYEIYLDCHLVSDMCKGKIKMYKEYVFKYSNI